MKIWVLTLFPEILEEPLKHSILGAAQKKGLLAVHTVDIREYTRDRHRQVDDDPYGGGFGMVMKPGPIFQAVEDLDLSLHTRKLLLSPQGEIFLQSTAKELAEEEEILLLCGRYEGVDERVRSLFTEEISIGDYVLTGGEIPALVVIDAVARMIPGVLGKEESFRQDSFYQGLLDHPHYTRPRVFRGLSVPEVLLSGDHARIRAWRRQEAIRRTLKRRPDLLKDYPFSQKEREMLQGFMEKEE